MRLLFIALALVAYLNADEMKVIENIVKDISELRSDYDKCKAELKSKNLQNSKAGKNTCAKYKKDVKKYIWLYRKTKNENKMLKEELKKANNLYIDVKDNTSDDVDTLKRQIKKYALLLKIRESKIKKLQKKLKNSQSSTSSKYKKFENPNKFPKLVLKNRGEHIAKGGKNSINTKPSAFRLSENAKIYNSIDGDEIFEWEKGTSFTSNVKADGWIKITGHFVNKKWRKSKKEMWVKADKTIKR